MRVWICWIAIMALAGNCIGDEETIAPLSSITITAKIPPPYGKTTVVAELNDFEDAPLAALTTLEFRSTNHHVRVAPDLLANFDRPHISGLRISYGPEDGGIERPFYVSIDVPFGEYSHGKTKGYSWVSFIIVDGELESYSIKRPGENGYEWTQVKVKPQ